MEVLKSMKQEMKERDNQLKLQLQLKDEYREAELGRRDQNLEDAVTPRFPCLGGRKGYETILGLFTC